MNKKIFLFLWLLFWAPVLLATNYPNTFVTNVDALLSNKVGILNGNPVLLKAKAQLIAEVEKILEKNERYSVCYDKEVPFKGSIHDYYSLSRYAWPNPETETGLPYVGRDGEVNPEIYSLQDSYMLGSVCNEVYKLGLAYFYTEDERYVNWIKELIKVFFIEEATRMNPNFEYAQVVKGKTNTGGATIGAFPLVYLIDGIQLVQTSKNWEMTNQDEIEKWFEAFFDWMLNSEKGKNQGRAPNNIGTYYTVQVSTYALFLKKYDIAKDILLNQGKHRVDEQINEFGELSFELKRGNPFEYVKFAVTSFDLLMNLSSVLGVDLIKYKNSKGTGVLDVHYWLLPYALGDKKWDYSKEKVSKNQIAIVLLRSNLCECSKYFYEQMGDLSCQVILTQLFFKI
ncbi:alginate lyase family protein [Flavobacterium chuncheonense]|uniref:Alginate lyase family protein n=1 Tax=Flavobacterium chuncheonense TaxID=2026653 RepID=A0ABW5YKV4_9FLAO